ncbi:ferredoxin [Mycolicibacterium sp. CH28]|uniref:ferredoxin n=1 Tax=Mycolicibacterium sp. CH28 TaxID=2512237 RepID=UPI0010807E4D|nr:ferredoxin [Mycolicibacterium sp. CH28]TGD87542.1 ferredoxin [Mycolicibacterium sp. CH28]
MKVSVNANRCQLHGECTVTAPGVFEIGDDDTVVRVINPEPEEEYHSAVEDAATMCPLAAIRVVR